MRKLILASAGAGKSHLIAQKALEKSAEEKNVLVLTYTENNQKELLEKICRQNNFKPSNIIIKGWFRFLLEDMIRPYQSCIFSKRISNIHFNKNGDPHKNNGTTIPGTAEKIGADYNPIHFLTRTSDKAHTTYLSKLATRIVKENNQKNTQRIAEIYDTIFIDEVQDLIGWDFNVVEALAKIDDLSFFCVGDFRQTVYSTHSTSKKPKTNTEKIVRFQKIGFTPEYMNISWRCAQPICDFARLIHADENLYPVTTSKLENIPDPYSEHIGVFTVSENDHENYITRYNPVILRLNRLTKNNLCNSLERYNFGESKGLGFDRVLIYPTKKQKNFLTGNRTIFSTDKTDSAKNILYVASTRARYSVAFLQEDESNISIVNKWTG